MLLGPATDLHQIYGTLLDRPLIENDEFEAYYREDLNGVRGEDQISNMAYALRNVPPGIFYKAFLYGHSGVGKSTEMTRFGRAVKDKYRIIRFSAQTDLNASGFQPFDVLLIMMIKLIENTAELVEEDEAGATPVDALLADIERWFAAEKHINSIETKTEVDASGGIKTTSSYLQKVLGLFVDLKGDIKYTTIRKTEVTERRLKTLADLLGLLNRALSECNRLLVQNFGCEWIFIGEDFDKPGIPNDLIESTFISFGNVFSALESHLIISIPVALAYSEKATTLLIQQVCLPDTPVFWPDHTAHEEGRHALRLILEARIVPELFTEGEMMRLIVASGGNLRDLFEMTIHAGTLAGKRTDGVGPITKDDVTKAISKMRRQYLNRLGTSPYDDDKDLKYDDKVTRLLSVYQQVSGYKAQDAALRSLLRARAVQEFNGEGWLGVHPLVEEILRADGKI